MDKRTKRIIRRVFFYALVPILLLAFLAQPIGSAALASDTAAFLIQLAALAAVGLNWLVYTAVYRKRPSFVIFAHGLLCVLIVVCLQYGVLIFTCEYLVVQYCLFHIWIGHYRL